MARAVRVNALVMAGGVAGYLLLGITGGVLATVTQVAVPGSFRFSHGAAPNCCWIVSPISVSLPLVALVLATSYRVTPWVSAL